MKGHVEPRGKDTWRIFVDTGKDSGGRRVRHSETIHAKKKSVAEARLANLLVEIDAGTYIRQSRDLLVSDFLQDWIKTYVELKLAPKTQESYRQLIEKHLIPEIGCVKLINLEPRHLQTLYKKKMDSGLSGRTVRYLYSLMRESLNHAIKMQLVKNNVAIATDPPRATHKTISTMAKENLNKFFDVAKNSEYYPLIYTLLHAGIRRGEALALKWKGVDLGLSSLGVQAYLMITESLSKVKGEIIMKEPKTLSGKRRVALTPSLALVLRQHRQQQETLRTITNESYVFCHPDGTPYDPTTISHAFADLLHKAGIPPMPLHGLRHTCATYLLEGGVHPKVVQEMLGHSSIRVTLDTYSHTVGGLQEAAVQKLDDIFSVGTGNGTKMAPAFNIIHGES